MGLYKERGPATLAFSRWLIRTLELNLKTSDDLELLQFLSLLFNRSVEYYGVRAARPDHGWSLEDAYWGAEQLLKSKRGLDLWRGPRHDRVVQFMQLFWKIAFALLKRRGGSM